MNKPYVLPFGGSTTTHKNAANGCKSDAARFFRALAKEVGLEKDQYNIRYNACGDWGETTFHTDKVYLHVNFDVPPDYDLGVLGRTCKGRKDFTGGKNEWLTVQESSFDNVLNFYREINSRSV